MAKTTGVIKILTNEFLVHQYHTKRKSIRQIAQEINCDPMTICYAMKKHNIKLRGKKESTKNAVETGYRKMLYGKDNPAFKGGYIRKDGYRVISVNGEQRVEHRYIWEQHTGKVIPKGHQIHHKNENKLDNRLNNLQLINNSEHQKLHKRLKK